MNDTIELQIAASAFKDSIPKDKPLAERVAYAFRYVQEHQDAIFWMSHRVNDDLMLRTSLAAVMMTGDEEDREMITRSLAPLKALSALMAGVPVDMSAIDTKNILPLMQMFREAKEPSTGEKT